MRREEVGGIMVGYKGHVPRSRDKVGASAFGGIATGRTEMGFPPAELTAPGTLPAFGAQTSNGATGEHPLYVSVAMAHGTSTVMAGPDAGPGNPYKPTQTVCGDGYIPRAGVHKPGSYEYVGSSIYGETFPQPPHNSDSLIKCL